MRNSRSECSYRSHVNDNKSQSQSRNFEPVLLLGQPCIYLTKHIISSRDQAPSISSRFRVNGCKNFIPAQVHTGLSSSRSDVKKCPEYHACGVSKGSPLKKTIGRSVKTSDLRS